MIVGDALADDEDVVGDTDGNDEDGGTDGAADAEVDVVVSCRFFPPGGIGTVDTGISALTVSLDGTTVGPVDTDSSPPFEGSSLDRGSSTGHKLHTWRSGSQ